MTKIHPHLLSQIFNRAHLMTPEMMALAVEFSRSHLGLAGTGPATTEMVLYDYDFDDDNDDDDNEDQDKNDLAVIAIAGPLVPRTGNLKLCQQMTAYETVGAQVDAALADPSVAHIVFDIDSPGGASTGAFELADKIRAAGQVKPTSAIVNFNAMSGAYLLAAACNEISLSQSGGVGSIGVIAQHLDVSKMNEAMGIKITAVYRGDKKNNLTPNEPLSESSLQELDEMVGRTYQQFTGAVAQYRSMPVKKVIDTQAGLYFGQDAIDAGLADRLETPQSAINRIAAGLAEIRATKLQQSRSLQLQRQAIFAKASAMRLRVMM
jgi:capsid assembly protease